MLRWIWPISECNLMIRDSRKQAPRRKPLLCGNIEGGDLKNNSQSTTNFDPKAGTGGKLRVSATTGMLEAGNLGVGSLNLAQKVYRPLIIWGAWSELKKNCLEGRQKKSSKGPPEKKICSVNFKKKFLGQFCPKKDLRRIPGKTFGPSCVGFTY